MNVFRESRVKNASICSLTSVTVVVVVVVGDVVVVVVLENGAGVTMGGANRILLPRLEVPPRNDTNTGSDSCAFLTKDGFVADTTTVGGMIMVVVIIIHGSRMMIIVKRHGSIIMLENVLHWLIFPLFHKLCVLYILYDKSSWYGWYDQWNIEVGFVQMFPHFVDHVILEWIFTHVSGVTSLQGIL